MQEISAADSCSPAPGLCMMKHPIT